VTIEERSSSRRGQASQVNIFMSEDLWHGRQAHGATGEQAQDNRDTQGGPKGKPYSVKLDFYLDANTPSTESDWVKMEITRRTSRR